MPINIQELNYFQGMIQSLEGEADRASAEGQHSQAGSLVAARQVIRAMLDRLLQDLRDLKAQGLLEAQVASLTEDVKTLTARLEELASIAAGPVDPVDPMPGDPS